MSNDIQKYKVNDKVTLNVNNGVISINIEGLNKLGFIDYTDQLFEIVKNAKFRIPSSQKSAKNYKYIYSNEYNKSLHQIVFDYYFGENIRKKAYESDYIIEHLDNDGFNCVISNLFLLKKVKNTYKGWNFDKVVKESLPILGLRIFHILKNRTFQITIAFNKPPLNRMNNKAISNIRLLYDYNYEIVLQDAEQILESIVKSQRINFGEWRTLYRFKDIRINYRPEIEFTDEEKKLPSGSIIYRDDKPYLLVGQSKESYALINSIPYDKDWDYK